MTTNYLDLASHKFPFFSFFLSFKLTTSTTIITSTMKDNNNDVLKASGQVVGQVRVVAAVSLPALLVSIIIYSRTI